MFCIDVETTKLAASAIYDICDFVERLLQIGFDVVDMFDSDTQTNEIFGNPGSKLFFLAELLMSCRCRCNDQL